MKNVVIAGYVRSPFTFANRGELAKVRPDELAGQVIQGLMRKTSVKAEDIEDLILGCAFPEGEQGLNVARLVGFLADLPLSVSGVTVNRFCGSSMCAIHMAAGSIRMEAGEVFICAGVESMTRVPMTGFNPMPHPGLYEKYPQAYISMGITAENVAVKYRIPREPQEAFAADSQAKAAAAQATGKFDEEIVPITHEGGTVSRDGCIRADTTPSGLAGLKPAFDENGTVTAGTASPLTDGASATLICSEEYAERNGLEPLARIKGIAVSGCQPEIMGIGPVAATRKALGRAGLSAGDMDIASGQAPSGLAGLKPAFDENGTVTAGTASPLTDGASATLICSEEYAERNGLEPLARIKGIAVSGCQPEIMGIGPVAATRKALGRAGLSAGDMDIVELNEAFASQSIACIRELQLDPGRINIDGGAIALGHPLGATGARITGKAATLLRREGGAYALSTQCIGGGQGIATILEAM